MVDKVMVDTLQLFLILFTVSSSLNNLSLTEMHVDICDDAKCVKFVAYGHSEQSADSHLLHNG